MHEEEDRTEMDKTAESERMETARMIFTGLGIGLLAGLAIGILIAPKTGRDTRSHLKELATDWSQKAKDIATTFGDKVSTTKEAIKRGKDAVKDTYKEKTEEA